MHRESDPRHEAEDGIAQLGPCGAIDAGGIPDVRLARTSTHEVVRPICRPVGMFARDAVEAETPRGGMISAVDEIEPCRAGPLHVICCAMM